MIISYFQLPLSIVSSFNPNLSTNDIVLTYINIRWDTKMML